MHKVLFVCLHNIPVLLSLYQEKGHGNTVLACYDDIVIVITTKETSHRLKAPLLVRLQVTCSNLELLKMYLQ